MINNFSKNFKSGKKSAFVFLTLFILLFCPIMLNAQEYIIGVAVCDTICPNSSYLSDGPDCSLYFSLNSALVPYVTGLNFQIEITAVAGVVLSNFGDTIKVGDTFSLPVVLSLLWARV